jgi:hypothetical protein
MIRNWKWTGFLLATFLVLAVPYVISQRAKNEQTTPAALTLTPQATSEETGQNLNKIKPLPTEPTTLPAATPLQDVVLDTLPLELDLSETAVPSSTPTIKPQKLGAPDTALPQATSSNPALSALQDIERAHPDDSLQGPLVGFLRSSNGSNAQPTNTPVASQTGSSNLPLVGGQARGYVLLYLMHPRARQTTEAQIQNLIDANIQQVYLSVLVDGTFGKDHAYLQSVLQRLHDAGKEITLVQYLVSGPTMRTKDTPIRTYFSQRDPIDFRTIDLYEPDTQQEIIKVAREARASFEKNNQLSPNNISIVSVMLEDNLESVSYRMMRNIASQAIGNSALFLRSACPSVPNMDNDEESWGDPLELHKVEEFARLQAGDAYTLDGVDVTYPGDTNSGDIDVEEVRQMIQASYTKGLRLFGLWRKNRQGIGAQGVKVHPDNRDFAVPTSAELELERSLLREGLAPLKEE